MEAPPLSLARLSGLSGAVCLVRPRARARPHCSPSPFPFPPSKDPRTLAGRPTAARRNIERPTPFASAKCRDFLPFFSGDVDHGECHQSAR